MKALWGAIMLVSRVACALSIVAVLSACGTSREEEAVGRTTQAVEAANYEISLGFPQGRALVGIALHAQESLRLADGVILQDAKGKKLAENDDIAPNNLNSRLLFTPEKDGVYRLVVTAFQGRGSGPYTLIIREFQDQPGPRNPDVDPKTPPRKDDAGKEKSKG